VQVAGATVPYCNNGVTVQWSGTKGNQGSARAIRIKMADKINQIYAFYECHHLLHYSADSLVICAICESLLMTFKAISLATL
jgi:hypothetical protein